MTVEEKKVAVLIWLATDVYAAAPNNTDSYISSHMIKLYPDLANSPNWATELHDILEAHIAENNVSFQDRKSTDLSKDERWYSATLKGKAYAKKLLEKRDALKYVRRSGIVENKLSPIEMADKILYWFCLDINQVLEEKIADSRDRKNRRFVSQQDAAEGALNYFIKDGQRELNSVDFAFYYPMILDKLVKDGYINFDEKSNFYSQNIEGVIFSRNGGYIGKQELDFRQKNIQRQKDWLIIFGTSLAGIGGIGICVIEILKRWG